MSYVLLSLILSLVGDDLTHADYRRGQDLLDGYLRGSTQKIANRSLEGIRSREDWERQRPELRRQFLEMMGLWPLPARTDLHVRVTGRISTEHFHVERMLFQSSPGLYVTANLYIPKLTQFPAPTVLYLCGHSPTLVDGVPQGNKVSYHHHPQWFAEHGYVCLILDTLELGEIPGVHHGTYRLNQWWWQSMGYTPAGIECWNAMRALDYLETRPEVDRRRIGVTGRSGGGATSWWIAAADDRVQCIIPVAGIADLWAHVVEGVAPRYRKGVISGHCDCMYFVNTYQWDFPQVAALCVPRPLMLENSRSDDIFPEPGYRRLAEKVKRIYELYGASEKFQLIETEGPHKDTPELRLCAYHWMNRWLKGEDRPVNEPLPSQLAAGQLRVLDQIPDDARNGSIQETFLKPASFTVPESPAVAREWWLGVREEWLHGLREKVFRAWPTSFAAPPARLAGDMRHDGVRLRAYDFTSEEGVELRLWLMTASDTEKPRLVLLNAVNESGWKEWLREIDPVFKDLLLVSDKIEPDHAKFVQNRRALQSQQWAFATIAPRGVGPTRWAEPGSFTDIQIRRRFALLGTTLDATRVWDVRRTVATVRSLPECSGVPISLQGAGEMAGVVLYAAIFEPRVTQLELWHPTQTHREGPILLGILKLLDLPQAVALAFPRPVQIHVAAEPDRRAWEWPVQLQKALGREFVKIRVSED